MDKYLDLDCAVDDDSDGEEMMSMEENDGFVVRDDDLEALRETPKHKRLRKRSLKRKHVEEEEEEEEEEEKEKEEKEKEEEEGESVKVTKKEQKLKSATTVSLKAKEKKKTTTAVFSKAKEKKKTTTANTVVDDSELDDLQRYAVEAVVERQQNVFLTGKAGVGKSRCIAAVVRRALALNKRVALTATTGLAAQGLGQLTQDCRGVLPSTVHRFAGITPGVYDFGVMWKKISKNKFLLHRLRTTDIWIIDEVSMLSPVLFSLLYRVAQHARYENFSYPFGGITMLLVGDFFQLPPIMIDESELAQANGCQYCFETDRWRKTISYGTEIVLQHVYRQRGDSRLIDILNEVRHGTLSQRSIRVLQSRTFGFLMNELLRLDGQNPLVDYNADVDVAALKQRFQTENREVPSHLLPLLSDVAPTKLMAKNALVDQENRERLAELVDERSVQFHAQLDCSGRGIKSTAQSAAIKGQLSSGVLAPACLELKRYAQVMLLANLSDTLVNGSRGVVLDFVTEPSDVRPNYVTEPRTGRRVKRKQRATEAPRHMESLVANVASDETPLWPLVLFDNGEQRVILPYVWSRKSTSPQWRATLAQVPLRLAWAISIHKSQGMSISLLSVDLRQVFSSGQSYVALSRARSLDGLMLETFDPSMIVGESQRPNAQVIEYYERLEAEQSERLKDVDCGIVENK